MASIDEFQNILHERQIRDVDTALYECRKIAKKCCPMLCIQALLLMKGKIISMNAYRLLRVLAGPEHQNDLIIVGDAHQRIYKK
jgi:hypothetical protein